MSSSFTEVVINAVKLDTWEIKLLNDQYQATPDRAWVDLADVSVGLASALKDSPWLKVTGIGTGAASLIYASSEYMEKRGSGATTTLDDAGYVFSVLSFASQVAATLAQGGYAAPVPHVKVAAVCLTAISTILDALATAGQIDSESAMRAAEEARELNEKVEHLTQIHSAACVELTNVTIDSFTEFGELHDHSVEKLNLLSSYHSSAATGLSLIANFRKSLFNEINSSGIAVDAESDIIELLPQYINWAETLRNDPINFASVEASYSEIVGNYSAKLAEIVGRYQANLEAILSRDGFLLKNFASDGDDVMLATVPHDVLDGGAGNDTFDLTGITENKLIYDPLGNNKIRINGALVGTITRAMQDGSPTGADYVDEAGNHYSIVPSQAHDLSSDLIIKLANGSVVTVVRWSESPGRFGIVLADGEESEAPSEPVQSTNIFTVGSGAFEVVKDHELVVMNSYDAREATRGTVNEEGETLDQSFINSKEIVYEAVLYPWSGGKFEGADLNDRLLGNNYFNDLSGRGGDDYIDGRGGNDLLVGGDGSDYVLGGDGMNFIYLEGRGEADNAGSGDDYALGGSGTDLVSGGGGNDYIDGGEGNNSIAGGSGKDTLIAGSGDDHIYGDGYITYEQVAGGFGGAMKLQSDTSLTSDAYDDVIRAGDGDNQVEGGAGSDTIVTGSGADRITGDLLLAVLCKKAMWRYRPICTGTIVSRQARETTK